MMTPARIPVNVEAVVGALTREREERLCRAVLLVLRQRPQLLDGLLQQFRHSAEYTKCARVASPATTPRYTIIRIATGTPQLRPALTGNAGIELRRQPVSDLSQQKLKKLVEIEGYDDDVALIADAATDSVCPAICMNEGCDYTAEMEPDQDRGWCESLRHQFDEERARARRHHIGARPCRRKSAAAKAEARKVGAGRAGQAVRSIPRRRRSTRSAIWSVKKVNGKWYISQAARFDDKEQWSRPYETLQRATTAIARKLADEVMKRHKTPLPTLRHQ